jgi:hypothetical protein
MRLYLKQFREYKPGTDMPIRTTRLLFTTIRLDIALMG